MLNPCAADLHQSMFYGCLLLHATYLEADICLNADFCGDTDVKFGYTHKPAQCQSK